MDGWPVTGPAAAPAAVVGRYLAERLGDRGWRDCTVTPVGGGKSNLTFLVASPAGRVVLRRPPLRQVLPTAHDMAREYRVIAALAGSDVPVPAALQLCTDEAVLGAPFYVMSEVPGYVVRDRLPAGYADRPEQRAAVAAGLLAVLARLHAVDPAELGLAGFGRPAGYLSRQLRRWTGQWAATAGASLPELDVLAAELTRTVPERPPERPAGTLVHGDYRLDNVVLAPDRPGAIAAVLDWELSTLGDPLADLGLLLVYWSEAGDAAAGAVVPSVTALPGFPARAEVAAQYARLTGRDVGALPWYVAFGCFKLAVVVAGILARVRAGAMLDAAVGDGLQEALPRLAGRGRAVLAGGALD